MAHKTPLKTVALASEMEVGQGVWEESEVLTMEILEEQIAELKLEAVTTVEVLNDKLQEEKGRHALVRRDLEEEQAKRKLEGKRFTAEEQSLKKEVELLRSEAKSLRAKLEMCSKELAESKNECRESQDKVSSLMKELNDERSEVVKYMEISMAAGDDVDAMTDMLSQAEDDSRFYLAEREGDKASMAVMSLLVEALGAQLVLAQDDIASATGRMRERLEGASSALSAKLSEMSVACTRRDEEVLLLREQVASLTGELRSCSGALAVKEREISELETELGSLSGYLAMTMDREGGGGNQPQEPAVTFPPRDALKSVRDELEVMRLDLEASRREVASLEAMRKEEEEGAGRIRRRVKVEAIQNGGGMGEDEGGDSSKRDEATSVDASPISILCEKLVQTCEPWPVSRLDGAKSIEHGLESGQIHPSQTGDDRHQTTESGPGGGSGGGNVGGCGSPPVGALRVGKGASAGPRGRSNQVMRCAENGCETRKNAREGLCGEGEGVDVESDEMGKGDSTGVDVAVGGEVEAKLELDETLRALLDARSTLEATKGALMDERSQLRVTLEEVECARAELRKLRDEMKSNAMEPLAEKLVKSNRMEPGKLRDEITSSQIGIAKLRDEFADGDEVQFGDVRGVEAVPPSGAGSSESPRADLEYDTAGYWHLRAGAEQRSGEHREGGRAELAFAAAAKRNGDGGGEGYAVGDLDCSMEGSLGWDVVSSGGVRHGAVSMCAKGRYKELLEHLQALQNKAWEAEERANRTEDALRMCSAALKGRESESIILRQVAGGADTLGMELERCRCELEECRSRDAARGEREGELRECWMAERQRGDQLMEALDAERARAAAMERRIEENKDSEREGDLGGVRAQLSKARGYIRELSQAGSALEDRFLILQQEKIEAENASEEMEKRLKCALAGLEDEASELRAAQEEVARLRMSLEEAAVREEGLKSELDATLERLEETIACAGITPCIPLAPPNAFAPSLALAPRMQSSPEAGVGRLLHQQHQWLGLDEGAHLRGVFAARNNGTEHRAEHGRRGPPGVEPASVECVHRGKVGGSQGGSIDYWAARAMYQGAVGRETLQRGAGLSTASCLGDGALAEVFDG